jgi:methionyl-tRNA synthetase
MNFLSYYDGAALATTIAPFLISPFFLPLIIIAAIWGAVWKGIALWKSGRNNQLAWFIVLLLVNTLGILEIIYILFFQRKIMARIVKKKRR